jgi:hypothetical protein
MKLIARGIRAGRSEGRGSGKRQELLDGCCTCLFPPRARPGPRYGIQDKDDRLDLISPPAGQFGEVQLAIGFYGCFDTDCLHRYLPCVGLRLLLYLRALLRNAVVKS